LSYSTDVNAAGPDAFFFEAAILSRIRSPVTSRSNWGEGQEHV
jgi:hypothetical protein